VVIQADAQGSRRKLTDAFLRALAHDWQAHGEAVIKRVREDNPVAYFRGMLSLIQKDVSVEGETNRVSPSPPMYAQALSSPGLVQSSSAETPFKCRAIAW
jgi:hypothetical protein